MKAFLISLFSLFMSKAFLISLPLLIAFLRGFVEESHGAQTRTGAFTREMNRN
jgi:hypothetical protein